MLDKGIIPYGYFTPQDSFEAAINSLPKDERRATKRKFRKLWRKAARKYCPEILGQDRTKSNSRTRRVIVKRMLKEGSSYSE
jgi:hypothetical protein